MLLQSVRSGEGYFSSVILRRGEAETGESRLPFDTRASRVCRCL